MLGMTIASALTFFFSFLLGYIVFRRNISSRVRQAFLLLAFTLGAWSFIAVFTLSSRDHSQFALLFMAGTVFQMLHFGTFLHFSLAVTGKSPKREKMIYLVYIPCAFSILLFLTHPDYVSNFFLLDDMWHFNHQYSSAPFFSMLFIWFGYYGYSFHLYLQRSGRSVTVRERRIFQILAASVLVIITITFLEAMILPLFFDIPSHGRLIIFKFLWLLCIGFLVDRYRFLTAPAGLEDIALTAFPGCAVFILDKNLTIRKVNQEAARILFLQEVDIDGVPLSSILPAAGRILEELVNHNPDSSLSGIISAGKDGDSRILLDMKGSVLHDKGGDPIGFILVGKEVKGRRHLNLSFSLSRREIEIIEQILQGLSNAEIAEGLFISERTVTTHITHIFTKLGVENRIQLYALLKDNQFISGHPSDKKLLIPDGAGE